MISPKFHNIYTQLPESFFSRSTPTPVKAPSVINQNEELALELGFDLKWLSSQEGIAMFSGNSLPKGADPIAQVYAGHQFGGWSPRLGDGRAHLIGQVQAKDGSNWDIQLKGSGPTPYSRSGDGRAWLGPVLREYLISEAMYQLDIPTTRALASVVTGETVYREKPLPGAILTRVAPSLIRVGTFEYFSSKRDTESISQLLKYSIAIHFPALDSKDAIGFLDAVISKQATLISKWMGVGFIHGVMNTDNTHVGGITIDYGPCAFMDDYIPSKVFSSIDVNGRYSYEEQPKVIVWNLVRLAISLLPLIDNTESEAIKKAELSLSKFDKLYQDNFRTLFLKKIGISHEINGDLGLLTDLLNSMTNFKADFTQTFIELSVLNHNSQIDHSQKFLNEWKIKWANRLEQEKDPIKVMSQTNPMFIPRNHLIEHAIQNAIIGDYKLFNDLLLASKNPFKKSLDNEALYTPPESGNLVSQTFCGT